MYIAIGDSGLIRMIGRLIVPDVWLLQCGFLLHILTEGQTHNAVKMML